MVLPILQFPNPQLRVTAQPVNIFGPDLSRVALDLIETMRAEKYGIGLAATQVGIPLRVLVMEPSRIFQREGEPPRVVVNPVITLATELVTSPNEACLSVPGYSSDVPRYRRVTVQGRDLQGDPLTFDAEGLESFCFQHEIDHLDGKLFIDRISRLKREMYLRRRKKQLRQARQ